MKLPKGAEMNWTNKRSFPAAIIKVPMTVNARTRLATPMKLIIVLVLAICASVPCVASDSFIVRASSSAISGIVSRHGLTLVAPLDSPQGEVFLLNNTSGEPFNQMEAELEADVEVQGCEGNPQVTLAESAVVNQSTAAILDGSISPASVQYFGTVALGRYVSQPATAIIRLRDVQNKEHITGAGIVAVIDTGVDPNHPVLTPSLLPGYDFVHDVADSASEFSDLPAGNTAVLNQSTAAILDKVQVVLVNQSTAAILDQSTAAILDTTQLPAAFGHGTMVAGIVHLAAPTAKILPLKAFSGDGTGTLANILRAIYYAVDHGAKVLNMSFSLPDASQELMSAMNYATQHGVIPVAAVGNTGQPAVFYPAALSNVIGVGSTSDFDVRSAFSSYGSMVYVAAPGEGVVTTYPGGNYAAAWGTSFSAPFVAGAAALIVQVDGRVNETDVAVAIGHGRSVAQMGRGRIDLYQAVEHAD